MADALLSPAVGGTLWAVSAAAVGGAARKTGREGDERLVPLMGMTGAFVFAAQMVNFTIPGTGSSGHLGGGLLLALLLGSGPALVVMASVLLVQALFFADGGLLAFGCNVFNLGLLPAFVAAPLVARPLVARGRPALGILLGAVAGLQLGAFFVVVETAASGVAALPFLPFLAAMLPVHLAIGLVEGAVTLAVWRVLGERRPELVAAALAPASTPGPAPAARHALASLLAAAVATAGLLSWAASDLPDGLERSIERTAPAPPAAPEGRLHAFAARVQARLAPFPDYAPRRTAPTKPAARAGTSAAGLAGVGATLGLVAGTGLLLRRLSRRRAAPPKAVSPR